MKHKIKRIHFLMFILILLVVLTSFYFHFNKFEDDYEYYEKHYSEIVNQNHVKGAFDKLKSSYKTNPNVKSMCHQITHIIGRAAAKKYSEVGKAFQDGDSFCWSGYYHGVMEGVLSEYSMNSLKDKIKSICSNISGKESYSFDYYNCVHGLGHGIMYMNGNELFDALKVCEYLDGWWEQNSCYGGVFMENVITDDKNHFTNYLKTDDVFYPCSVVEEKYAYQCYLMQTSHMLDVVDDFAKVFDLCEQLDEKFEDICYQSLGRDASGSTESDTIKTRNICMLGKNYRQKSNCIIGAAKDFVAYFHSDAEARMFCKSLPAEFQKECLKVVDDFVKVL